MDPDLSQGIANVSIYGTPMMKKTTRYPTRWRTVLNNEPTFTLTASGATVTVGGAQPAAFFVQNFAIFVANSPYTYSVQPTDTPTSIASALATLIAQQYPGTTSSGPVITLAPNAALGVVRVGGSGIVAQVVKNQERLFQVTLWCNTPAQRTALENVVDPLLSGVIRIVMPDGYYATIRFHDAPQQDLGEKARLFRMDLRYMIDYATTKQQTAAAVIVGTGNVPNPLS
ncbi:hypothetical protein [Paraburkholderia phosphatilytica]|uniref:hypothetical protein n=1 Tax=Paraburkholderia phosphatilytica TaxID=2282883 RepID=UPI000F5F3266|nr:hypothetical protein [Paraburkholderia phosphatilytica]